MTRVKIKEKSFRPFSITLKIDTKADAILLYHIFNRVNLRDAVIDDEYLDGLAEEGKRYIKVSKLNILAEEDREMLRRNIASCVQVWGDV